MLKAAYRSSLAALVAGLAAFALSIALNRVFRVPGDVVFAPGLAMRHLLNTLGADLPRSAAVLTTLIAWCMAADAVFLVLRKPWRSAASRG